MERSVGDYLRQMENDGLFSAHAPAPEHNPRVWEAYAGRLQEYGQALLSQPVVTACDKYAFFLDALDDARAGLNWAPCTSMVDPMIPASRAEFLQDLPRLIADLEDQAVCTDTFSFTDGYLQAGDLTYGLPALNSPVAVFGDDFSAFVESLTQERRKKFKRSIKDFDEAGLTFSLSAEPLCAAEITFARDNLHKRWGDESFLFSFSQTLWAQTVAEFYPANALFMRVHDKDQLVFVQTVLLRHGAAYAQSIFKSEEHFYNGIAAYTDFKTIEALCGKGPAYFDPSCRTGFEDPESIGIAKRATVNHNLVKPVLVFGNALSEPFRDLSNSNTVHGLAA